MATLGSRVRFEESTVSTHERGQLFPQHVVDQVNVLGASAFSFEEQHAWLIDSGASCHMIGEGMLDGGHVEILEESAVSVECSLASGEPIVLRRKVSLSLLRYSRGRSRLCHFDCSRCAKLQPCNPLYRPNGSEGLAGVDK